MKRRERIHIPGGVYYVVQEGGARRAIFTKADDYVLFERLLAKALRRSDTLVYAYCWAPDAIHLVLRIDCVPLSRFVQGVTGSYARSIHNRDGGSGHFFRRRYRALLIDPNTYLLKLINYVHHLPLLANLAPHPAAWPYTSHHAYVSAARHTLVNTRTALQMLAARGGAEQAYQALMNRPPSEDDIRLFNQGGDADLRIIGGADFIANLPHPARAYRSRLSLDQVIHDVSRALGLTCDDILSRSRRRDAALARALIAWFVIERRIATLTEVARRMNRDPSTLSMAITRNRMGHPDLFRLDAFHYLTPVGGGPAASNDDPECGGDRFDAPTSCSSACARHNVA